MLLLSPLAGVLWATGGGEERLETWSGDIRWGERPHPPPWHNNDVTRGGIMRLSSHKKLETTYMHHCIIISGENISQFQYSFTHFPIYWWNKCGGMKVVDEEYKSVLTAHSHPSILTSGTLYRLYSKGGGRGVITRHKLASDGWCRWAEARRGNGLSLTPPTDDLMWATFATLTRG